MPEVVFYALGGRSVEQKRALIKDFTDAVVKNYKVDPSAVTITIVESQKRTRPRAAYCSATWVDRRRRPSRIIRDVRALGIFRLHRRRGCRPSARRRVTIDAEGNAGIR